MSGFRTGRTRIRVRFGETDAAGIAYFGTFFGWFDLGTQQLIRVPGVPSVTADGKPTYPLPMVECKGNFFRPVRFDQELDVVSAIAKLGETSVRVEHEVRTLDGDVVARGYEQRVFVRFVEGGFAKHPIPPELRDHLSATEAHP